MMCGQRGHRPKKSLRPCPCEDCQRTLAYNSRGLRQGIMRLITHNVYWFQGYPSHCLAKHLLRPWGERLVPHSGCLWGGFDVGSGLCGCRCSPACDPECDKGIKNLNLNFNQAKRAGLPYEGRPALFAFIPQFPFRTRRGSSHGRGILRQGWKHQNLPASLCRRQSSPLFRSCSGHIPVCSCPAD